MSLEQALKENTEALRLMTLALNYCPQDVKDEINNIQPATVAEIEKHLEIDKPKPVAVVEKPKPAKEIVYADVSALIIRLSKEKNRESALAVLGKFDAKKLPEVKPEHFTALYNAATEALEAA